MQTLNFPPSITWLVRANIVGLALLSAACGDDTSATTSDSDSDSESSSSDTDPTDPTDPTSDPTTNPTDTADTSTSVDPDSSSGPGEESSSGPGEESSSGPGEESSSSGGGDVCGNDVAEGAEECDGDDLAGADCISQNFDGGNLACAKDCSFDTSGCFNMACGNDLIEGKEVCDGDDLADATCASLGYVGGTLACADNCGDYDISGCITCGNDVVDGGEACDGMDLDGETCVTQGFAAGELACAADCTFDTTPCLSACADENIGGAVGPAVTSGNTAGDDNDLDGSCGAAGGNDRVISFTAPMDGNFVFDTFGSDYDTKLTLFGDCDPGSEISCNDDFNGLQSQLVLPMSAGQTVLIVVDGFNGNVGNWILNISTPVCGDDLIGAGEVCDGSDVAGLDCPAFGFDDGAVACQADCQAFDTSGCSSVCGNDLVAVDEACDGDNLAGATCLSQGFEVGDLACADDCGSLDTSGCGAPLNDCCFANGAPGCSDDACEASICALDPFCCNNEWDGVCANAATGANGAGNTCDVCAAALCGNDLIGGAEVCDGTDLGGEDCGSQGFGAGVLGCAADCLGYDTSDCLPVCGDQDIGESTGAGVAAGSTVGADNDLNPSCGVGDAVDHVMEFTAPWAGTYTIDTLGSGYDTVMALWSDCASEIACSDDAGGTFQSSLTVDLADGQTILILVDGWNGATGNWILNITAPPQPIPDVCDAGVDPGDGSPYVVCSADANGAWISANTGGNYHPELICQELGYTTVGEYGGTCGNVCGYCEGPTACDAPGAATFDIGVWNGVGNCGSDGLGQIICNTVQWTCI